MYAYAAYVIASCTSVMWICWLQKASWASQFRPLDEANKSPA